tara:strand:- start:144 stop:701 length:558 start_codon:yes stop_codon:yes gene_type:complete
MDITNILAITLTLFAVIDIFGSIPVIINLREKTGSVQSLKATLVSGFIMIMFLFLGEQILNLIGIDFSSFAIAGAIVIFLIGIEMILGVDIFKSSPDDTSGTIVPIAFPLIAGAGTLTTLISLRSTFETIEIITGIIINLIIVYIVLKTTSHIEKLLGKGGVNVLRRIFGIILMAISIKLFKSNW